MGSNMMDGNICQGMIVQALAMPKLVFKAHHDSTSTDADDVLQLVLELNMVLKELASK
jgi:hypothetical protein